MSDKLREMIKLHEGLELKPYVDSRGKLSIGYGRCLETAGISLEEAEMLLTNDLLDTRKRVELCFDWFNSIDSVRQDVIIMMAYNLGVTGLSKFYHMIDAIKAGDFQAAGDRMLESVWSRQVGNRSFVLFKMMKSGNYPDGSVS